MDFDALVKELFFAKEAHVALDPLPGFFHVPVGSDAAPEEVSGFFGAPGLLGAEGRGLGAIGAQRQDERVGAGAGAAGARGDGNRCHSAFDAISV